VPTALHAAQALAGDGVKVRVVSMPCIELFEAQPQQYRDEVLPRGVTARLAVEPGATISWWKWVGLDGDVLGLDRFGASAPGTTVLEKLGFTSQNIVTRARALLERAE
jgi:transketolase